MNTAKVEKQSKHSSIVQSIERIGLSRDGLQNLLNRITGQESPPTDAIKTRPEEPRLSELLNEGGEQISNIATDLNRIREELQAALF